MADNSELERRVSALEAEMADVRMLAAGADADVSRFDAAIRGQRRVLNALRETQVEHGQRLAAIDVRFDAVDARFDGTDGRFDRLESRFDGMDDRLDGLDTRFDGLEARFERLGGAMDAVLRILGGRPTEGGARA